MIGRRLVWRIAVAVIVFTLLLSAGADQQHLSADPNNAGWEEVGINSATNGGISNTFFSVFASVAIAPDGVSYVAWTDANAGDNEIYVRRWSGSSWEEVGAGSATNGGISNNSGDSWGPSMATAPNGTPYVAWVDDSSGNWEIYTLRWNGSSWEEVGTGSASGGGISSNSGDSGSPSIAVAPNGSPYVAWSDDSSGNWEIYTLRWNGSSWEEVGVGSASGGGISSNDGVSGSPSLAISSDSMPYITWHNTSGGDFEIYVRRWNGNSWEEVGIGSASGGGISNNIDDSECPSIAITSDGIPYVAWYDWSSGNYEIYVRRWNGSTWEEVGAGSATGGGISNNNGDSGWASIAVAPDNTPCVTWHDDSSGNWEIYIRRWNGSLWGEVGIGSASGGGISDNDGWSAMSSIAIAPDGTPYVAWDDNSSGNYEIYVRRWGGGPIVDIGFRPNPDGYQFANYIGTYPLPPTTNDYTVGDMRRMFGDDVVCRMVGPICFPKWSALTWLWDVNRRMANFLRGGHCDGMAVTSLRFFKYEDSRLGVATTYALEKGDNILARQWNGDVYNTTVRRHIAYYQILQFTYPMQNYIRQAEYEQAPLDALARLMELMSDGDLPVLHISQGRRGHALIPYAVECKGSGVYWVWVYDNNRPGDDNRYMVIDVTSKGGTWSYEFDVNDVWSGDASTHSLHVIPVSKYGEQPRSWYSTGGGGIWLIGKGHLLITDSQGRRIGYVGDQFVNEIPGAYESIIFAGSNIGMEPIYTIPLTDTYTILLDGQTLTQTEAVAITQFGPGYAVSVDDVTLEPNSQDELIIASDGTQLTYQPSNGEEATLTLALDGENEGHQLQINGADIGAGQVATLAADNGRLVFNNAQTGGGEYDLEIRRASAAGEQKFAHYGVTILATDTHYLDYGAWDGSGPITLSIDHGSDGTIDETVELKNQAYRIFLPFITKNHP